MLVKIVLKKHLKRFMDRKIKVLFTGGSHAEIPMIEEAKKSGFYVLTLGSNRDGLGHKLADKYIYGDFSDKEFVYHTAKENDVDAIISGCNDFAYISTAYACEKLGLKGHDSYEIAKLIHHKDSFREMTRKLGIKTPKNYRCFNEEELRQIIEEISFPIIVKPIDLTGGKGVKTCFSKEEALNAFNEALNKTREDHVIIEEYILGSNHGASFILKDQKVLYKVFDNEQYYKNKYLVSGASMPGNVSKEAKEQLVKDIEKIANHLELVDGLFHFQFIVEEKTGYPIIIDPCRRSPGDLYVLLAKYASRVDYPKEILNAEMGIEINENYNIESNNVIRECIMSDRKGVVKAIDIDNYIENHTLYKMIWGKEKDVIDDELKYKAGIIISSFEDNSEMNEIANNWYNYVRIEMDEKI